jgi:hypothetical protein
MKKLLPFPILLKYNLSDYTFIFIGIMAPNLTIPSAEIKFNKSDPSPIFL